VVSVSVYVWAWRRVRCLVRMDRATVADLCVCVWGGHGPVGETWNFLKMGYQLKQVRERIQKGLVDKVRPRSREHLRRETGPSRCALDDGDLTHRHPAHEPSLSVCDGADTEARTRVGAAGRAADREAKFPFVRHGHASALQHDGQGRARAPRRGHPPQVRVLVSMCMYVYKRMRVCGPV
jgi:hypothetical protein